VSTSCNKSSSLDQLSCFGKATHTTLGRGTSSALARFELMRHTLTRLLVCLFVCLCVLPSLIIRFFSLRDGEMPLVVLVNPKSGGKQVRGMHPEKRATRPSVVGSICICSIGLAVATICPVVRTRCHMDCVVFACFTQRGLEWMGRSVGRLLTSNSRDSLCLQATAVPSSFIQFIISRTNVGSCMYTWRANETGSQDARELPPHSRPWSGL
jgi:hypothetical protein